MLSNGSSRPIRVRFAAAALVAACATAAVGMRFTVHLDALETELTSRTAALVGELNRTQIKDKKLYDGSLNKLDKDTNSAKKEIALTKKVGAKLDKKKPDDVVLQQLIDNAAAGLTTDVRDRLSAVKMALDQLVNKVKPASVQKAIDKGNAKLDDADQQVVFKKRMARIKQGEAMARKGEKLVAKLGGGGNGNGNGNGNCPGTKFNNQESGSMKLDGVLIVFDRWEYEPVPQTGLRWFRLYRCNPPVCLQFTVPFPKVQTYNVKSGSANDVQPRYREFFVGPGGTGSQSGVFDVTEYTFTLNASTITATFELTLDNNGGEVTEGRFNLTEFLR